MKVDFLQSCSFFIAIFLECTAFVLKFFNRAIGYEDCAFRRSKRRADIKDNACLLSIIGGQRVAENIGNAAKHLAFFDEVTAVDVVQPAACFQGFQVDEVFYITRAVVTWLDGQGEHFQLAQDVTDIIFISFNILVQAKAGTTALDEDRWQACAGSVVISTTCR